MTSALEGARVLISCVIMYVTRGEGVKKFEIFMDVIDGSPLSQKEEGRRGSMACTSANKTVVISSIGKARKARFYTSREIAQMPAFPPTCLILAVNAASP